MSNKFRNINFSLFFKANLLITSIIFLLFLQYNDNYKLVDFTLALLGAISTAAIIYVLLYLFLFVFKFTGKFVLYFSAVIFTLINMSLLVDFFIYKLFKFHINAMVINILTSPDAMDSVQAGLTPVIAFIVVIIALFVFELYLIKKLVNTHNDSKTSLNRRLNKLIIIPLLVIVLGEKVSFGFASLFAKNEILAKFKVIPMYQPLTFNRLAARKFGYKPVVQPKNAIALNAKLNYPLKPMTLSENPQTFNIFIFGVDSVKSSIINKKTTPNLEAFKKDSIVLNNHHTGGNSTRFGIFSLMYGLNATYWFPFADANKGTVLFDVLKTLNYQINITSSTNTNWPEFKNTCYVQIQDSIKDDFEGDPWKKDEQATAYFKKWLGNQNTEKPIFSFVFFDAPHGYSFPKEANPFNASKEKISYMTLTANSPEIAMTEKQYKSAVYYDDKLFGEMLDTLKEKGLYENSMIIYTSDHGQEFFEFGDFGHNTNFSSAQTKVPMVIKLPSSLKGKPIPSTNTLTSHVDIVPTLLSLIGTKNPANEYSNGQNIFDDSFARDQVTCSNWTKNSIISDDLVQVFSNTPDKIFNNEIRDSKTYQLLNDAPNKSKMVLQVLKENRRFLK